MAKRRGKIVTRCRGERGKHCGKIVTKYRDEDSKTQNIGGCQSQILQKYLR
ncbi:MAG: hypothetical protein LBQ05_02755 [Christensenellaceae bacterium]|nr:hypothetical protein [Christensenellaceae bacterium]